MGHPARQRTRFGAFEVDSGSGELLRQGIKVDLQDQPFQVLVALIERPGELITREELRTRLWVEGTFVDFDRGLNKAVNKLRRALEDDADNPRFIETLPQRGYRFVASVEIATASEPEPSVEISSPPGASFARRQILPWLLVAISLAAAAYAWTARVPSGVADKPLLHLDLDVGPEESSQPSISPDGMRVVYVSNGSLALRRLDQPGTVRLAGTEGAFFPFFSPDGRWVAFNADGKLKKLALEGGTPIVLCNAQHFGGGSWGKDGYIVAAMAEGTQGLFRIPAVGGVPQQLTDAEQDSKGALSHLWPQIASGGEVVLFAAVDGSSQGSLRLLSTKDGTVTTLVENATRGRILPRGHLVYYWRSKLYGAKVDLTGRKLTGLPVPLVSDIANFAGIERGEFDLSDSGTLVYQAGSAGNKFVVSWLSPSGGIEPVLTKPDTFLTPRLSPDGSRLAVAMTEGEKQRVWIYDLKRGTWVRLTSDEVPELLPAWSSDGEFVAFRSGNGLAWTQSDGSGDVSHLHGASANVAPWSFSGDGKWLLFWPLQPGSDLFTVPVERAAGTMRLGSPKPLLEHPGAQGAPAISGDDRWVAYTSNESGIFEIYVVPFSPRGSKLPGKWLISSGGGTSPVWSRNGHELLYQGPDRRVHAASYQVSGNLFLPEKPRVWSPALLGETGIFNAFDLGPDDNRVIALLGVDEPMKNTPMRVMLNVDGELRRILP